MISAIAPAKLNLFLRVCDKTSSGHHRLDSVVSFTEFGDRVMITPAREDKLTATGSFAEMLDATNGAGVNNLVMRALHAFRESGGDVGSVSVTLEKNIPVGAGLGGGSSDAATFLRLINDPENGLTKKTLCNSVINHIARNLGADVPVCLAGTSKRIAGIGETLTDFRVTACPVVLVNPMKPLSTAAVFSHFDGPFSGSAGKVVTRNAAQLCLYGNDLQTTAIELMPEIDRGLQHLGALSGCVASAMSGSGASCFGIFSTQQSCENSAKKMQEIGFWAVPTQIKTNN